MCEHSDIGGEINRDMARDEADEMRAELATRPRAPEIVMSVPYEHRETFFPKVPGIKLTYDVLSELFKRARREICIFSPRIDATFTNLAMQAEAPMRVITTLPDRKKNRNQGIVERCGTSRDIRIRYIHHRESDSDLYQLHSKMILADDVGYVGSSNLTDASLHYNFELGFLVKDAPALQSLKRIFDYLYEHVGFPAKVQTR